MQRVQGVLNCQIDGHRESVIIGVCVNKQCQHKRPFCVGCQYQFHNTHIGDLKCFNDLKNWNCLNTQTVENLKNYLDDLNGLIQKISKLIEATSQRNTYQNYQEMNFTDLHNNINDQITLWNHQEQMQALLQELFPTNTRDKIRNICSIQLQINSNNYNLEIKKSIQGQDYLKGAQGLRPSICYQNFIQVQQYPDQNKSAQNIIPKQASLQIPQINYQRNFQANERQNQHLVQSPNYNYNNNLKNQQGQNDCNLQNKNNNIKIQESFSTNDRKMTQNANQNIQRTTSPLCNFKNPINLQKQ
ncbi:unnamed protein product [Paramecium primaurelia]|uniref:Uncharacterized protein n=1 Tax=Paramecium primaurelia TaxID=5886 RepID=A0A8S1LUS6_PARPR|nr:unnamed protein product [Paramecium primaurelia]